MTLMCYISINTLCDIDHFSSIWTIENWKTE